MKKYSILLLVLALTLPANLYAERNLLGSVRITDLKVYDFGESSGEPVHPSIDISQDVCDEDQNTLEQFFETRLVITVTNDTRLPISLRKLRHIIPGARSNGRRVRSPKIRLGPQYVEANGGTVTFPVLLTTYSGSNKQLLGTNESIPSVTGLKNMRITIRGRASNGTRIRLRTKQSVNFVEQNRCE